MLGGRVNKVLMVLMEYPVPRALIPISIRRYYELDAQMFFNEMQAKAFNKKSICVGCLEPVASRGEEFCGPCKTIEEMNICGTPRLEWPEYLKEHSDQIGVRNKEFMDKRFGPHGTE